MAAVVTRREVALWAAFFVAVSAWLVATGFTSEDPDSALYAALSARLAEGPVSHWIAPEWWGHWDSEGLFREHPAGVFLLPTLLGAAGVPGVQAAYIVGLGLAAVATVLFASIVGRLTTRADARAVLLCLQLMPLASIFRIRANHEYPMLVCLLVAIIGLDAARRSWRWAWVTPVALTAALLVKGVFVLVPILALGFWAVINPSREPGGWFRPIAVAALSIALMGVTALVYDAAYLRVTGEAFWGPYWARQLAPLTIATPVDGGSAILHHIWFYLLRVLWHPAPWSWALVAAVWFQRGRLVSAWRALPPVEGRALAAALGAALAMVLLLVPASRFAERYIFSANYLIAVAGIVVARRMWPRIRAMVDAIDARIPAAAVWLWLILAAARLVVGPYLPRISG
jgi:4-amino-4-deoxy-L-arabinose transferase-like glycosyltransferase